MFLSIVFSSSCTKERMEDAVPVNKEMATLNVSIGGLGRLVTTDTKSASIASGETAVNSVQVFVFDSSNGLLDAYSSGNSLNVSLSCRTGSKTVYAILNAPTNYTSVTTISQLSAITTSLSDNSISGFVMVGYGTAVLGSSGTSVSVIVSRMVSRIAIMMIYDDMSTIATTPLVITGIYLVNLASDCNYGLSSSPSSWFNQRAYSANATDALTHEDVSYTFSNGAGYVYSTPHYFYAYPNNTMTDSSDPTWSPRFTRLVVAATLSGSTCYYPINLPNIESNKTYVITELHITRKGSDSPDIPIVSLACSYTLTVLPWNANLSTSTTI